MENQKLEICKFEIDEPYLEDCKKYYEILKRELHFQINNFCFLQEMFNHRIILKGTGLDDALWYLFQSIFEYLILSFNKTLFESGKDCVTIKKLINFTRSHLNENEAQGEFDQKIREIYSSSSKKEERRNIETNIKNMRNNYLAHRLETEIAVGVRLEDLKILIDTEIDVLSFFCFLENTLPENQEDYQKHFYYEAAMQQGREKYKSVIKKLATIM